MSPIDVMIVDDHAVLRAGLRLLVSSQPDMRVVGEAGRLSEALEVARRVRPRVITLDLSMPGPSGVASIEHLRAVAPDAAIIVLTMHEDPAYVRAAMATGASGYVNKSAADTELLSAIRAVAEGRVFIDVGGPATAEAAPRRYAAPGRGQTPLDSLSDREREILAEVAKGLTNQRIAESMGLSVKTVESYRARVMKKLGFKDRADLVRLAIELGLLSGPNVP